MESRNIVSNSENLTKKERKNKVMRKLIFDTATELFARKPYDMVSMENIAERVALSRATLYRYFSSKEEIFFQIGVSFIEKFIDLYKTETKNLTNNLEKLLVYLDSALRSLYMNPVGHKVYQRLQEQLGTTLKNLEEQSVNEDKALKMVGGLNLKDYENKTVKTIIRMDSIIWNLIVEAKKDQLIKEEIEERDIIRIYSVIFDGFGWGVLQGYESNRSDSERLITLLVENFKNLIIKSD